MSTRTTAQAKLIVEGMAYALWVHALSGYAFDETGHEIAGRTRWAEEYDELVHEGRGSVPEAAMQPAMELVNLYEITNGRTLVSMYSDVPFGYFTDAYDYGEALASRALGLPDDTMLAKRARALNNVEPVHFEVSFTGEKLVWTGDSQPPTTNPAKDLFLVMMVNEDPKDTYAVEYEGDINDAMSDAIDLANPDPGDSLAYAIVEARDAGAARLACGPRRTPPPIDGVWDGGFLSYKRHGEPVDNPARKMQVGYDLTEFEPGGFQKVLQGLGIWQCAGEKIGRRGGWLWSGKGIRIVTANDPITGQYSREGMRADEPDYASYMGVEGTPTKVRAAKKLIAKHAVEIKYGPERGLKFINFEDDPEENPAHGPTRAGERSRHRATLRGLERTTAVIPPRTREQREAAELRERERRRSRKR